MLKKRILRAPGGAWIILSGARLAQFKMFLHRIFTQIIRPNFMENQNLFQREESFKREDKSKKEDSFQFKMKKQCFSSTT
jgi:hypothetical protein